MVAYFAPAWHEDGACGEYPSYAASATIARYWCRLYFEKEEKVRREEGASQTGAWIMIGDPAEIVPGGKVVRANGQAFTVVDVRKPLNGRVEHHQRVVLRRVSGEGSEN